MVVSGQLRPGQQLPTIRQLATDLRINYNTAGRAYGILDQEGVISTQQGRGTYITSRMDERHIHKMRQEKLHALLGQGVQEAVALGYSRQEIEDALQEQLRKIA
jgi:GntR family transcriptional regulator